MRVTRIAELSHMGIRTLPRLLVSLTVVIALAAVPGLAPDAAAAATPMTRVAAKESRVPTMVTGWRSGMTIKRAKTIKVSGPRGRRVKIQKRSNGEWRTVKVKRTSKRQRVNVALVLRADGTWRLRVPAQGRKRAKTTRTISTRTQTTNQVATAARKTTKPNKRNPKAQSSATPTPAVAGTPDAGNTGVPAGTTLRVLNAGNKPYPGDYISGSKFIVTTPGAVYDRWQFDYLVEVRAPGVRFTRSLFRGVPNNPSDSALLKVVPQTYPAGQPSAVAEDSSLIPSAPNNHIDGVRGSNFTLRRVEITKTVDGVHVHGSTARTDPAAGNVTIERSWIHDLPHYNDTSHSDGTHNDGVQIIGGHNIRITNNRIDGTLHNAGVMITQGRNNVSNVTINNNHAAGGGCTINVADGNHGAINGLSMNGNTFTRNTTRNTDCAMIVTNKTRAIATATNNTWHNNTNPTPYMRNGG